MANHRAQKAGSSKPAKASPSRGRSQKTPPLSPKKLWFFRVLSLVGAPFLFVVLVELCLRVVGYGYPTAFLLPASQAGKAVWVQNNQFGWRFFGPRMSRLPEPISISQDKPADVVRIFLFGESAAKGEPQPAFGVARMMEAILSLRHPETHFEVVNVAMTAINSHTVRSIARDCTRGGGDIWVIYMGNNEVVGPFGAGTVFGGQSPPLWMIRATLALKATRSGQLMESLLARLQKDPGQDGEWRGMKMFLDQQVKADDPRMKSVYQHFQSNLNDIIRAGRSRGAGIVVSTVAVNLRDCAPFASAHRAGLAETDLARWESAYQLGIQAQTAGNLEEAVEHFREAAVVDDSYAELRFRQAQCALALGKNEPAREHFRAARDLDTLRFRCDSKLNELIRQASRNREDEQILLADAEAAFASQSPGELPGGDVFYEHVHPNFKGNYLLARTLAGQVEKLLPAQIIMGADAPWPSEADCARRLGWSDWSRIAVLQDILLRIKSPPFTGQINHDEQLRNLASEVEEVSRVLQAAGLVQSRSAIEKALLTSPDDAVLYKLLSALQQANGNPGDAIASARRGLTLLPSDAQAWLQLGLLQVRQQNIQEAASAFHRAIELDPADVLARQNLAQCAWLLGRRDEAISEYRKAVEIQPSFSLAWINLGQALEESGRKAEADECYRKALAERSSRVTDMVAVARFCRSRGWGEAAVTNYSLAVNASSQDANLRLEAGENLMLLNRTAEAFELFADAVRVNPQLARARLLYGSGLGQQGRPVEAEQQFREALRIDPGLLEARLNLGVALMSQGRAAESLICLEDVLRVSPTNELALRYVQRIRTAPAR